MKYWRFLVFIILLSTGCRDKVDPPYFGFEYYGWQEGKFVTYEVFDIFHDADLSPSSDTNHYILKTVVGETIIDNEGREANKLYRYSYDYETGELLDLRVWNGILADSRGELVEENQRIIRMVFAITREKTWNINAFNTKEEDEAHYKDIHSEKTINGIHFDSTVTVEYEDFFSLIDDIKRYDVYAKDVGLVKRSYKDLVIQNFDTLDIQYGTELYYNLIDYGVE